MTDHPANGLSEVVHQRTRLGILTVAHQAKRVEFTYLREALGLTAGNLSQHLTTLLNAGLITVDKGYEGNRPRTWVQLTRSGKQALLEEVSLLKALINEVEAGGGKPSS